MRGTSFRKIRFFGPGRRLAASEGPKIAQFGLQAQMKKTRSERAARLGSARLGSARLGSARLGSARLGSARLGSARRGSARLGSARLGSARLGLARLGSAWLGSAREVTSLDGRVLDATGRVAAAWLRGAALFSLPMPQRETRLVFYVLTRQAAARGSHCRLGFCVWMAWAGLG